MLLRIGRAGVALCGWLIFAGAIPGAIGGWIYLAGGADPNAPGSATFSTCYLFLLLVFPLTLVLVVLSQVFLADERVFAPLDFALGSFLVAGALGAGLGSGAFVVAAANVMTIFGGKNADDMYRAVVSQFSWAGFALVLVVTLGAAAGAGWWLHRRALSILAGS